MVVCFERVFENHTESRPAYPGLSMGSTLLGEGSLFAGLARGGLELIELCVALASNFSARRLTVLL
jgi:hypothetical protein